MQKEQMRQFGSSIDDYTFVVRIVGDQFGLTQTIKVEVDKMLRDLNKRQSKKGKKNFTREDILLKIQKGGSIYNSQINLLCSTPSSRGIVDNNINYVFIYYDENMNFISEIEVSKLSCQNVE